MALPRENIIVESVGLMVQQVLQDTGYDEKAELVPFPEDESILDEPLGVNKVAPVFDFGDDPKIAQMGGGLLQADYVFGIYVFGLDAMWLGAISTAIRDHVLREGRIPLYDFEAAGSPVMDYLTYPKVTTEPIVVEQPRAWERYMRLVKIEVEDYYVP